MPYLIDGHNLISHLPDLDLADPHDEAKLVLKLRGFCARTRKKITVIFDEGLPGGTSGLTTHSVKVIFASSKRQNADTLIRQRIAKTRDAKNWTLVSSDNEVLDSARMHGMKGMKAADFADLLTRKNDPRPHRGINPNVFVSPGEVAEWLAVFGDGAPTELEATDPAPRLRPGKSAKQSRKARKQAKQQRSTKPKQPDTMPTVDAHNATASDVHIAGDEVDEWLHVFGEKKPVQPTDRRPNKRPSRRNAAKGKHKTTAQQKPDPEEAPLHDVGAWLEIFGGDAADAEPTDLRPQRSDPSKQGRFGKTRREPTVHKNMATSDELFLSSGEVEAWMEFFGVEDEDDSDD